MTPNANNTDLIVNAKKNMIVLEASQLVSVGQALPEALTIPDKNGNLHTFHFATCQHTPDFEDIAVWIYKMECKVNGVKVVWELHILND